MLSKSAFIYLYLSFFVFILSKFVNIKLRFLQNLYKSKSPKSKSSQAINNKLKSKFSKIIFSRPFFQINIISKKSEI